MLGQAIGKCRKHKLKSQNNTTAVHAAMLQVRMMRVCQLNCEWTALLRRLAELITHRHVIERDGRDQHLEDKED